MKTTRNLFFSILVIQSIISFVLCWGDFNCTKNGPIHRGMCSIHSDVCCESVTGHDCKRELSQNWEDFSPQLHFINNSLTLEYRPNLPTLVCIQGAYIDKSNAFKGTETKGIFIEVTIRNSRKWHDEVFSSTTLFPGRISRNALENSLNCVEVDVSEDELAIDTNFIQVRWVPLPVAPDRKLAQVYPHPDVTDNFVPVCEIRNARIYWSNCFEWNQQVLPTKSCKQTTETTPDVTEDIIVTVDTGQHPLPPSKPVADPFWKYVSLVLITVVISCSCSLGITTCLFCAYKHHYLQKLNKAPNSRLDEHQIGSNENGFDHERPRCIHRPVRCPDFAGQMSRMGQSSYYVETQTQRGHQNSMSCLSLQPGGSLTDSNLGTERYSGISRGLLADSLEVIQIPKTEQTVETASLYPGYRSSVV